MTRLSLRSFTSTSRRTTWFTILGLLLIPAIVAGVLLSGLWNPPARVDTVTAAIVNNDEPVTINDQLMPLGRQLAQAITYPTDGTNSTYHWVMTNDEDAANGLNDGSYAAVVTIPKNFSAAATSVADQEGTPEQAVISITNSHKTTLADAAITNILTSAATKSFGATLSSNYLQQVLLGFTDLNDGLSEASDGASELADGTDEYVGGVKQMSNGLDQLSSGSEQVASGASDLANGAGQLDAGASDAANGAQKLATGLAKLSAGLNDVNSAMAKVADGTKLAGSAAATANADVQQIIGALVGVQTAYASCASDPTGCQTALAKAFAALPDKAKLTELATATGTADAALNGTADQKGLVDATAGLATGIDQLNTGLAKSAKGAQGLADGLDKLASGTSDLASGADQLANGTSQVADGAQSAADGSNQLVDGAKQINDGSQNLASGLADAVDQVPTYTETQAKDIATVVADPINAEDPIEKDWYGLALLVALALWIGATLTWLILKPIPTTALETTRSTWAIAITTGLPGMALGAAQGALVGVVMLFALDGAVGMKLEYGVLCVLAGIAFAALQQGLAALLGFFGRFLSLLIAAFAIVAGVISTAPAWFGIVLEQPPLGPLVNGLNVVASGEPFPTAAITSLVFCFALGYVLAVLATTRKRRVNPAVAFSDADITPASSAH